MEDGNKEGGGSEKDRGHERVEESSESEKISYEFVSDFGYHVRSRLAEIFHDFVAHGIYPESACKFKPHLASYVSQMYSTHSARISRVRAPAIGFAPSQSLHLFCTRNRSLALPHARHMHNLTDSNGARIL